MFTKFESSLFKHNILTSEFHNLFVFVLLATSKTMYENLPRNRFIQKYGCHEHKQYKIFLNQSGIFTLLSQEPSIPRIASHAPSKQASAASLALHRLQDTALIKTSNK